MKRFANRLVAANKNSKSLIQKQQQQLRYIASFKDAQQQQLKDKKPLDDNASQFQGANNASSIPSVQGTTKGFEGKIASTSNEKGKGLDATMSNPNLNSDARQKAYGFMHNNEEKAGNYGANAKQNVGEYDSIKGTIYEGKTQQDYNNALNSKSTEKSKSQDAFDTLKEKGQELKRDAKNAYQNIKEDLVDKKSTGELKRDAKNAYENVKEKAQDKAQDVKQGAATTFETVKEKAKDVFENVKEKVEDLVDNKSTSDLKRDAKYAYDYVKDKGEAKVNDVKRDTKYAYEYAKDKVEDKAQDLKEGAKQAFDTVKEKASAVLNKENLENVKEKVEDKAQDLKEGAMNTYEKAKEKLAENAPAGGWTQTAKSTLETIGSTSKVVLNKVGEAMEVVGKKVKEFTSNEEASSAHEKKDEKEEQLSEKKSSGEQKLQRSEEKQDYKTGFGAGSASGSSASQQRGDVKKSGNMNNQGLSQHQQAGIHQKDPKQTDV